MANRYPPFSDDVTIQNKYYPPRLWERKDEALDWFERCVEHTMWLRGCDRDEAVAVERFNIAYFWREWHHPAIAEYVLRIFGISGVPTLEGVPFRP